MRRRLPHPVQTYLSRLRDGFEDYYTKCLRQRASLIIGFCSWLNVQLLIFPELSIPAACLPWLKERSDDKRIAIVAGSHYVRGKDFQHYSDAKIPIEDIEQSVSKNLCPVFLPGNSSGFLAKAKPSKYEREQLRPDANGPAYFDLN